jgi:hypothetical protein
LAVARKLKVQAVMKIKKKMQHLAIITSQFFILPKLKKISFYEINSQTKFNLDLC